MIAVAVFTGLCMAAIAGTVLALAALAYAFQRHLLTPAAKRAPVWPTGSHRVETTAVLHAGRRLQVWQAWPLDAPPQRQALVYFPGRREHPASILRALHALPQHEVLCVFPDRLGWAWRKPDQAARVADGLAVVDHWLAQPGAHPAQLSIGGRSFGAGLALQVAAARPVGRVLLLSPFDRLVSVLRARWPGIGAACLKDRYDATALWPRLRCPCLVVVGARDRVIAPSVSQAVVEAWQGAAQRLLVPDAGHRGLLRRAEVHAAIGRFLADRPG